MNSFEALTSKVDGMGGDPSTNQKTFLLSV